MAAACQQVHAVTPCRGEVVTPAFSRPVSLESGAVGVPLHKGLKCYESILEAGQSRWTGKADCGTCFSVQHLPEQLY